MSTADPSASGPDARRPRRPEDFDAYYAGKPPWDIDRPQPAFQHLADSGRIAGRVLDAGCGTGEHALLAAGLGLDAVGVDTSATAVERARRKATERGLTARFVVGDALTLTALGERFDTVLDCGLFHILTDDDRRRYTDSLHAAMLTGAHFHMLGFSNLVPGDTGPRRLTRDEIAASFTHGWHVEAIDLDAIHVTRAPGTIPAWLASIMRTDA